MEAKSVKLVKKEALQCLFRRGKGKSERRRATVGSSSCSGCSTRSGRGGGEEWIRG